MNRRHLVMAALSSAALGPVEGASAQSAGYDAPEDVYAALRRQPATRFSIGGGSLGVVFADGAPGLDRARVLDWVRRGATAVATYFGRFPVRRVGLLIVAREGDSIARGVTFGFAGSAMRIDVGLAADQSAFDQDWILVHEMVHLALPNLPRENLWLQEGNATYVEPIARAQAGQLDPAVVWRWSLGGMPKGEPGPGDQGLNRTPTWGRTYWGGATFWLLADIGIYQRTRGRRTLREALGAINRASGGNTARWTADEVMAVGDQATGADILKKLYAAQADTPVRTDLTALFRSLGVARVDDRIVFDDGAPLAGFRLQLTRRRNL